MSSVVEDKVVVAHGRPMPGRRLPQELIDVILEDLHDHKDALSKCCLVHSSWVSSTRRHLFHEVRLDFEKVSDLERYESLWLPYVEETDKEYVLRCYAGGRVPVITVFSEFLRTAASSVTLNIRGLDISLTPGPSDVWGRVLFTNLSIATTRALLQLLPNLRSLAMRRIQLCGSIADAASSPYPTFTLRDLKLYDVDTSEKATIDLLSMFPFLERLNLAPRHDFENRPIPDAPREAIISVSSPQLRELGLSSVEKQPLPSPSISTMVDLASFSQSPPLRLTHLGYCFPAHPAGRSLATGTAEQRNSLLLNQLLPKVGCTLQTLDLDISVARMWSSRLRNRPTIRVQGLSSCTTLQQLRIKLGTRCMMMHGMSRDLAQIIPSLLQDLLSTKVITNLTVVIDFGGVLFRRGAHPFDLLESDLAIALVPFLERGVGTIRVLRQGGPLESEEAATVALKLAQLHKRNALRFNP